MRSATPVAARSMMFERRLARIGVALAVLLLSGVGVLSYRSAVQQATSAGWVAHTHEVIEGLQQIVTGVAEAESALRAYAIMRDERFLNDFEPGITLARRGFRASSELTRDNPARQRLLRSVRPLIDERIVLLQGSRQVVARGGPGHVSNEAMRVTGQIRDLVSEAIDAERDLLRERNQLADRQAQRARSFILLALLSSIALVGGATFLADREMRQRRDAQHERLREVSLLLELGELLQACRTPDEAFEVIGRIGPRFFSATTGAISLFQASRNAVDVKARWGETEFGAVSFEPEQCWGLRRGRLHVFEAGGASMRCEHLPEPTPAAAACLPLLANGELLGALHLTSQSALSEEVEQRMGVFGEQVALAIANLQLRETLRNQSIRDPMTGLFNRRYTEETLRRELARASRESASLSLLAVDVDHFKRFNDSYGHETGDEVLKQIANVLKEQTRAGDLVSRMGGEELLVVLPNADLEASVSKADQLRTFVAALSIRAHGKLLDAVTISIGVSTFPTHGTTQEELMRAADAALYRAKHAGRNRVAAAE